MLTDAQLYHFAVHGWVLQENIFSSEEIDTFRNALDKLYESKVSTMVHQDTTDIKNFGRYLNTKMPLKNSRDRPHCRTCCRFASRSPLENCADISILITQDTC